MDTLTNTSLLVLQLAAAALHAYIAYCFYPDRKKYWQYRSFARVMAFCALFHLSDAVFEILQLLGREELAGYAYLFHVGIEYALCPFMVSNLLAEYTQLPPLPSRLAIFLRKILLRADLLTKIVIVYAAFSFAIVTIETLKLVPISALYRYPMHANILVMTLGLCWLVVVSSGLRPAEDTHGGAREPVIWIRGVLVAITVASIAADNFFDIFYELAFESNLVHFVTVPFALTFAWYRYRFELVDVILKQAVSLLVVVITISIGGRFLASVENAIQPLFAYVLAFVALGLIRVSGKALYGLWLPPSAAQEVFQRRFPLLLGQCTNAEQAISTTEEELGKLFQCGVCINKEADFEAAKVIEIDEATPLHIELDYIRGVRPWFSEALTLVKEAALQLHNTLDVLEWRAIQHRTELNNQALQTLAARAERDAMRAQIRPHFFFNVLSTMHSYVRDDPEQAELVIELLADLMRSIAQTADQDTYPLSREIDLAHTYLKIESVRHGERLDFSVDVDQSLHDHPIPPFSLQPLVENAIKYSVDSQLQKAEIALTARRSSDSLQIVVSDNGPGPQLANRKDGLGLALNNIRDRLDKLYGDSGSLRLETAKEGGALATLTIPWQLNSDGFSK